MDTWATSCLTPKIAMAKRPSKNLDVPFDSRWSGHDIIRCWDFYTVLVTMLNDGGKLPWKELWINGFVLDPDRKKMSKSKGNVVVPQDLVDKHGAEAIRLWAASAKWGTDGLADERIMEQKRKLVMKFFNAAKFVYGFAGETKSIIIMPNDNPVDLAFLAKLDGTVKESQKFFEQNDHTGALLATEQAFWDFCDNYLEIVKGRAYEGDESALKTLRYTVMTFCALFAPFMPFITEHIWRSHPYKLKKLQSRTTKIGEGHDPRIGDTSSCDMTSVHKSLHPRWWPDFAYNDIKAWGAGSIDGYDKLCELVKLARGKKTEANKSVKAPIKKLVVAGNPFLRSAADDIKNVLNVETLEFSGDELLGALDWAE